MYVNSFDGQLRADFNNMKSELIGKKANGHVLRRFQGWTIDEYKENLWCFEKVGKGLVNLIITDGVISNVTGFFLKADALVGWNDWK